MPSSAVTFGTREFLKYDPNHRVLICRECQYAIQKSALGSHLLRHKIFRGERQRLLSTISQLHLLQPSNVQLPPPESPPVEGLPVIPGYRCGATGCTLLCASSKRMRRHWSEVHGISEPPSSFARPAKLQTFFRGTQLKYFETGAPGASARELLNATSNINEPRQPEQQRQLDVVAAEAHGASTFLSNARDVFKLDIETIRYFYHFTTVTSLTLPLRPGASATYWQTEVIAQALQLPWLMCGLLAISARHLAELSDDEMTERAHRKRTAQFLEDFCSGWQEIKRDDGGANVEAKLGAQVICFLRCCHWTADSPLFGFTIIPGVVPFRLHSLMIAIQGCTDADFALRCAVSQKTTPESAFASSRDISKRSAHAIVPSHAPPELLKRFHALPFRLAEVLGKPDNALDVLSVLAATEVLVECSSLSYASNDLEAVWSGTEQWLRNLSPHSNSMVLHRNPAMLIVLAHWSLLLERAEQQCWFLRGLALRLRQQIALELPQSNAFQDLVKGLADCKVQTYYTTCTGN